MCRERVGGYVTDTLRVLGVISNPPEAWERWRLCQPFWRLAQLGHDVRLDVLDSRQGIAVRRGEVVVLPRFTTRAGRERETERWLAGIRRMAGAIILEADDDLWTDGFTEHIVSSRFQQGRTVKQLDAERKANRWFLSQVNGVTVSSEPLAEIVRGLTDAPVVVVPNAIDVRWFRAMLPARASWAEDGIVTIGWAGGRRPERDLEQMAEAWRRIARRYPHVRFVVAAPGKPSFIWRAVDDDSRIVYLPWQSWDQYPGAYQVDIGCCAVADTPFSRAKTPIKAWEYAAAGAAVVATPTLYGDCCIPAHGGIGATWADEWERALSYLVERRPSWWAFTGELARHVELCHSLDTQAARWPAAYSEILSGVSASQ